jgi:predicted permease
LRARLAALPGVKEASLASWFPLGFEGGAGTGFDVPGYDRKPTEDMSAQYTIVAPRYFAAFRIPLLDGRDFTDADDATKPAVAIINETMAKRYWAGQSPLGRKFGVFGGRRELTVIGVAKAGKYRFLNEAPKPFIYLPYQQGVWDLNLGVVLRTEGSPATFASALRNEIHALDPGVEAWSLLTMADYVQASFLAQKIVSTLLIAIGAVAVVLAAMGIYGVMAYVVSQRIHELGVRMALGATMGRITSLVLSQGMRLACCGLGVGFVGAFALSHSLTNFLYGVSPFDPLTFGGVAVVLAAISLGACLVPAWRAARVDPMVALRYE